MRHMNYDGDALAFKASGNRVLIRVESNNLRADVYLDRPKAESLRDSLNWICGALSERKAFKP